MLKKNNRGFTLAELLIVVAIIAVLVAIAIPVFTTRLEQSRETTDIANLRSAYAAAQVGALAGDENGSKYSDSNYYYNTNNSVGISATGQKLGKGTATDGKADYTGLPEVITSNYSNNQDNRDKMIKITFNSGMVTAVQFAD